MRTELAKIHRQRRKFEGIFEKFGIKAGYHGVLQTVLLLDVREAVSRKIVTDHLWFTVGKRFGNLCLEKGDVVRFEARVTTYEKGYRGYRNGDDFPVLEQDYRLSFPSNIVKVGHIPEGQTVLFGVVGDTQK